MNEITEGRLVRIVSGPLGNATGIVVQVVSQDRFRLRLHAIDAAAYVEVDAANLQIVSQAEWN